jgi:hypothetical protein
MAETLGWLTDKIVISELKIYHTIEQIERKDAAPPHRQFCRQRLKILKLQRDDLKKEISALFREIMKGAVKPKIYKQFKMYNDPRFLIK